MRYNNELQNIDNEAKAYLLGLFYSDGTIGSSNNTCSLGLHVDDSYILDELLIIFPFFNKRISVKNIITLEITNKILKEHLEKHGLITQKSLQNRELLTFPDLRNDLISHFVRGFFDGDGSVYKQKLFNIKTEIGSVSYNFISRLLKVLYDNKINFNSTCSYNGTGLRTIDYYKIYCSSYKVSLNFANYIYKDSTIFLKRKKDRFYVEVFYDNRERLICLICSNNNTVYIGFRNNKTRIFCKDCNKRTSIAAPINSNINSGEDELLES